MKNKSENQKPPKVELKPKLIVLAKNATLNERVEQFDELTKRGFKLNMLTGEYILPR